MKVMRILAKVFAIIGIVIDAGLFLYGLIAFIVANAASDKFVGGALLAIAITYFVISVVGIIVGIKVISSLDNYDKKTYLGVLGIIFLSLLGGVFYLIWNPDNDSSLETIYESFGGSSNHEPVDPFLKSFGEDYKERVFEPFDKVSLLDDCSSVKPKLSKGSIGYVLESNSLDTQLQKRFTKMLFLRGDNQEIYSFHNFVLKKEGVLADDYPYSTLDATVGKKMKLNRDLKKLKAGDEVTVTKVLKHGKYPLLNKCVVLGYKNNKKVKAKAFSFYLSD